jgi:hypothetical protein
MRVTPRLSLTAAVAALVLGLIAPLLAATPAVANYPDPDYMAHDADNLARTLGRQQAQATDAEYGQAFVGAGLDSFLADSGMAANDLRAGRIYTGGGRYVPGGSAGDPRFYYDVQRTEIAFVSRTGAKLTGHVWGGTSSERGASLERRPGVVITSGSIQGYEAMYFWAARELARRGYIVLTWDAQGQGRSEGVGHAPGSRMPTFAGFPSQQAPNFVDGTVDALEFMLSTPTDEYLPSARLGAPNPWTPEARDAQKAASAGIEQLDWVNPFWQSLDRSRIALAGHSLGGTAVSIVQQCADTGSLWDPAVAGPAVVAECGGRGYPVRAVVGWDSLRADVSPQVPGMNQQADGYFLNPTPAPQAPNRRANLAAHDAWTEAGVDTYSFSVRGGTHLEWTDLPYALPATSYGTLMATDYTAAWIDRYLWPDRDVRQAAYDFLISAPAGGCDAPTSGAHMSLRRDGAFSLTTVVADTSGRPPVLATESLRTFGEDNPYAEVGDWAAGTAECP